MKTRIENPTKNTKAKKQVRIEKIAKPIVEVIPEEKDREILLERLDNSNICIVLSVFQSAVIIWIKDKDIRKIMLEKLAGLRKVGSNENKCIFVTSPKYNTEVLEKIVRGIAKKIKQEREQDPARSFIILSLVLHFIQTQTFCANPLHPR